MANVKRNILINKTNFGRIDENDNVRKWSNHVEAHGMINLFRFAVVISAIPLVLKMALDGQISAEQAALLLIGATLIAVYGRPLVRFITSLVALFLFFWEIAGKDQQGFNAILPYVLQLLVILFAFYVMFGGLRKRTSQRKY